MDLENKCAIITGSTRGIGFSIAQALVQEGANVVISSRHPENIKTAIGRLDRLVEGRATGKQCDVREAEQVQELIQYCVDTLGGVDILINNAGVSGSHPDLLNTDTWDQQMSVNARGVFLGMRTVIPQMQASGGGSIVNISSISGVTGQSFVHMG